MVRYGDTVALRGLDLTVRAGEVVALMGRNGAGKSTLLRCFVGLTSRTSGSVTVADRDPATLRPPDLVRRVALVPQVPGDLLYADSVERGVRERGPRRQGPCREPRWLCWLDSRPTCRRRCTRGISRRDSALRSP